MVNLYDSLDSLEKAAANEIILAARKIYIMQKLKKTLSFEQWMRDIAAELTNIAEGKQQNTK